MPTYEFTCPSGHDFEKFFRTISGGASELPCPVCGLMATRKISAGAGLVFKGSGFYITDYGKDGKKDQRTASKPSTSASASDSKSGESSAPSESKSSEPASKPAESAPAVAPAPKPAGGAE